MCEIYSKSTNSKNFSRQRTTLALRPRTGAWNRNERRCSGQGPSRSSASRCARVDNPRGRQIRSRDNARSSRVISASRVTLATIEAAAIDSERRSPPITRRAGQISPSGTSRPSISAKSGAGSSAPSARAIARKVAPRMLNSSISAALANAMENGQRRCRDTASASARRRSALRALEFVEARRGSRRDRGSPRRR